MDRDFLTKIGFQEYPYIVFGDGIFLDLGRRRILSISSIGTPHEMLFLCERNKTLDTVIDESICLHNYDYDGYLTKEKLYSLLSFFGK
jgi:hypothetical protein